MNFWFFFPGVAHLFILASMFCGLYGFFTNGVGIFSIYPMVLLLYGPLVHVIDLLFLKKERSLTSFIILNLLLISCAFGSMVPIFMGHEPLYAIVIGISIVFFTINAATSCRKEPSLKGFLTAFDLSVAFLIGLTAYRTVNLISENVLVFPFVSMAVSLISIMILRQKEHLDVMATAGVIGALGLTLFLVYIFNGYASDIGKAVVVGWSFLLSVIKWIFDLVKYLFMLFIGLFPKVEGVMDIDIKVPEIETPEFITESDGNFIVIFGAIILVAIFVAVLVSLATIKIKIKGRSTNKTKVTRIMTLKKGFERAYESIIMYFKKKVWLRKNKNTPLGIYFTLKKNLIRS
ncbi:MAG: hypothetical protein HUK24_03185, partial [Sphaerochaetaceae bacterium]|nr:hypothetical protein [Sphaerochaetaceae bacterium]